MGRFLFLALGLLVVAFCLNGAKGSCCSCDCPSRNEFCDKTFDERKNQDDAEEHVSRQTDKPRSSLKAQMPREANKDGTNKYRVELQSPQGGWMDCPPGSYAFKVEDEWSCYKFYNGPANFDDAEEKCQNKWGGHLASFINDRESKAIAAYVAKEIMEDNYVWMGLRRNTPSDIITEWWWVGKSRSKYRNWSRGEPNNYGGDEFCGSLDYRYGYVSWNDLACYRKRPFLCKWRLT
ncbi:C-type lectin lectoxin-Thr1-like isoform X2 [Erythrolamprus reginae]|uniref:C-type lectin lectoxin-Thr1-like isoform X2 n=1 Tax=Erythrolamprus reginae TaxID=121349 RepID=UPI00396C9371